MTDMTTVGERIQQRIRGDFVELIGEEQFKLMVDSSVKQYTDRRQNYEGIQPSAFDRDMSVVVSEMIRLELQEAVKDPEFRTRLLAALGGTTDEIAAKVVVSAIAQFKQNFVAQLQGSIASSLSSQLDYAISNALSARGR